MYKHIILLIFTLCALIGSNVGIVMFNKYAENSYNRDIKNSTCSLIYSKVQTASDGFMVNMLMEQPRENSNYTQYNNIFFSTLDDAEKFIQSFPRGCFYINNSPILFYRGQGGMPTVLVVFICILFDFLILLASILILGNLGSCRYKNYCSLDVQN